MRFSKVSDNTNKAMTGIANPGSKRVAFALLRKFCQNGSCFPCSSCEVGNFLGLLLDGAITQAFDD